jgi:hypothetical protein
MAIARPLPQGRSRVARAWASLLGREAAAPAETETVSFAELVWAHHQRQEKEVYAGERGGEWHEEYARRLKLFCARHGEIVDAYWCRYEASGVALTERPQPRRPTNLFARRDTIMSLHTATDWRTADAPASATTLHRWQTAAIKAREILRDTSERIALHRIFGASTRLLAFVDQRRDDARIGDADLAAALREHARELAQVDEYYRRAGANAARLVYFRGMMWGTALLAALVGGGFLLTWSLGWVDPAHEPTYTLLVAIAMGAAGAILSVMTRMARDGFRLEFEVGRKSIRYLGGIRPWIGALSALAVYLALKSNLVEFLQASGQKGIYFYATIGFVSGFSERRAKVLLNRIAAEDDEEGRSRRRERRPAAEGEPALDTWARGGG